MVDEKLHKETKERVINTLKVFGKLCNQALSQCQTSMLDMKADKICMRCNRLLYVQTFSYENFLKFFMQMLLFFTLG